MNFNYLQEFIQYPLDYTYNKDSNLTKPQKKSFIGHTYSR